METPLHEVFALIGLGALMGLSGVILAVHLRLQRPPLPVLEHDDQVVYRVLLRHKWWYLASLLLLMVACIGQAILETRDTGVGQTVPAVGRGLVLAIAIMIAGQSIVLIADDQRIIRTASILGFDSLAPRASRLLLRMVGLRLVISRFLAAAILLSIGIIIRFPLSLPLGLACYAPITVLYVIYCVAEVTSRRIWSETIHQWNTHKGIFEWDGSLRDIYVLATTRDDWQMLVSFFRISSYTTQFTVDGIPQPLPEHVDEIFALRSSSSPMLRIDSDGLGIACHFFMPEELELDINPRSISDQAQLTRLVTFMRTVAQVLGKQIILTPENGQDEPWYRYDPGSDQEEWWTAQES